MDTRYVALRNRAVACYYFAALAVATGVGIVTTEERSNFGDPLLAWIAQSLVAMGFVWAVSGLIAGSLALTVRVEPASSRQNWHSPVSDCQDVDRSGSELLDANQS